MHHALKRDQSLMTEHSQDLDEQAIECLLMLNAKIRQRMIVNHFHPGQPLIGWVILTPARDLSGRTDAILIRINPQTDQYLGIPRRAARFSFERTQVAIKRRPIQLVHQHPDGSHRMLLTYKFLYVNGAQQQLLSFDSFEPNGFSLAVLLKGIIIFHAVSSTP